MSLIWGFVFYFLLAEVVAFLFLCLPFPVKMRRSILDWIAHSPTVHTLKSLLTFIAVILLALFVDSAREVHRRGDLHKEFGNQADLPKTVNMHSQMFRAQRNIYLSGFSLLLLLILNRFYSMSRELCSVTLQEQDLERMIEGQQRSLRAATNEASKNKEAADDAQKARESAMKQVAQMEDAIDTLKKMVTEAEQKSKKSN